MNNTISIKIITQEDVAAIFDSHADRLFEIVEDAFLKASKGEVLFPDKISQIFDTHKIGLTVCRLLYWEIK